MWHGEFTLYDWQRDLLNAYAMPHSRVAASICNFSGKTSCLLLVAALATMSAFRGARVYCTSGNEEQLKDTFFSLLQDHAEKLKEYGFSWEVNISLLRITSSNGSTCICAVKKDPKSVEGRHGYWETDRLTGEKYYRPLAYLVDEAKHVQNETEKAIRRIDPDFYMALSTPPEQTEAEKDWFWKKAINIDGLDRVVRKRLGEPEEETNELHDVMTYPIADWSKPDTIHAFPGEYWNYRRVITWLDVPHLHTPLRVQERKNIEQMFGKNSAFVRSTLYGIGSEGAAENRIFSDEEVAHMRRAMSNDTEFKPQHGDTRSAADVSGTSDGDAMVVGVRNGSEVLFVEGREGMDDVAQAEYLVNFNRKLELSAHQFIIDAGGIGAAIANRIEQTLNYWGVTRFQSNRDPTFNYQFFDRYSELHWVIKELVAFRVIRVPWCPLLLRDMRERRYVQMSGEGRIKCEEKKAHRKRVGHSPDWLDMIVYLFSDFPIEKIRRGLTLKRQTAEKEGHDGKLPPHFTEERTIQRGIMPGLKKQPSLQKIMGNRHRGHFLAR
jgi:hypothetical protein